MATAGNDGQRPSIDVVVRMGDGLLGLLQRLGLTEDEAVKAVELLDNRNLLDGAAVEGVKKTDHGVVVFSDTGMINEAGQSVVRFNREAIDAVKDTVKEKWAAKTLQEIERINPGLRSAVEAAVTQAETSDPGTPGSGTPPEKTGTPETPGQSGQPGKPDEPGNPNQPSRPEQWRTNIEIGDRAVAVTNPNVSVQVTSDGDGGEPVNVEKSTATPAGQPAAKPAAAEPAPPPQEEEQGSLRIKHDDDTSGSKAAIQAGSEPELSLPQPASAELPAEAQQNSLPPPITVVPPAIAPENFSLEQAVQSIQVGEAKSPLIQKYAPKLPPALPGTQPEAPATGPEASQPHNLDWYAHLTEEQKANYQQFGDINGPVLTGSSFIEPPALPADGPVSNIQASQPLQVAGASQPYGVPESWQNNPEEAQAALSDEYRAVAQEIAATGMSTQDWIQHNRERFGAIIDKYRTYDPDSKPETFSVDISANQIKSLIDGNLRDMGYLNHGTPDNYSPEGQYGFVQFGQPQPMGGGPMPPMPVMAGMGPVMPVMPGAPLQMMPVMPPTPAMPGMPGTMPPQQMMRPDQPRGPFAAEAPQGNPYQVKNNDVYYWTNDQAPQEQPPQSGPGPMPNMGAM